MGEATPEQVCRGCNTPVENKGPGKRREWCSERCRKQTLYSVPCVDCGKALNGSDGKGAHERCVPCAAAKTGRDKAWPRWEQIAAMRERGLLNKEIAERLDVSAAVIASAVYHAREGGFEIARTTYGPSAARSMR